MAALAYVCANADRLRVDPARLYLAGDSAGAQIAAHVAALVTDPGYARQVRIAPTVDPRQLRAVALCCGAYDPELIPETGPFSSFLTAILWSYSGIRHFRDDRYFSTMAVVDHLTGTFPPAFITAGNADPLVEHSRRLATALAAQGVEIDTLFYPADHQPPLQHEYQFDLDLDDARTAFTRLVAFLDRYAGY